MTRSSSRRRVLAATGLLAAATVASSLAFVPGASASSARPDLGKGHPAHVAVHAVTSAKAPTLARPFIAGYSQVNSTFLTDVAGTETFGSVTCPPGTKVVGGGAAVSSSSVGQNINSSAPTTDGTGWRVWINNADATDGGFFVQATCARQVGLYQVVTGVAVTANAGTQATAYAICPTGKVPLGGGGIIGSSDVRANLNSDLPIANGWRVDANNNTASSTSVTAYAICGKQPKKYAQVNGPAVAVNPGAQPGAAVVCPKGTVPLGGGAFSSSGSVLVNLNSSFPTSDGWRGYENNASAFTTTITAYAVCGKAAA